MTAPPKVILITDPRYSKEHIAAAIEATAAALEPEALLVQLRDKEADPAALLEHALLLRAVTRASRAAFTVNGDAALARAASADGVHLGGRRPDVAAARALLGRDAWISVAAHDDDDVRDALAVSATAVLVSPIFATPEKGAPRGVAAIAAARRIASQGELLVYALGGIDARRAAACLHAGADGVAVIRALLDPPDTRVSATALATAIMNRTPR